MAKVCLTAVLTVLLHACCPSLPADDRPPAGDRRDGSRDNRDGGGRMIGYATAAQSAQQVAGMLGGAAANDRRMQDQLNELLASKRASELWEVLRLLRDQFGGDRQAAVNWFAERPGVAKAVFQAQVLLGELLFEQVQCCDSSSSTSLGYAIPSSGDSSRTALESYTVLCIMLQCHSSSTATEANTGLCSIDKSAVTAGMCSAVQGCQTAAPTKQQHSARRHISNDLLQAVQSLWS